MRPASHLKAFPVVSCTVGMTHLVVQEFYIPELCNLLLEGTSACAQGVEELLFDTCADNIHFALLVVWNLQAAVESSE